MCCGKFVDLNGIANRSVQVAEIVPKMEHILFLSGNGENVTQHVDEFLRYMLGEFGAIDTSEIHNVFEHDIGLSELAKLPEEVIPLVVMRELTYKHKVSFSHKDMKNWPLFVQRYHKVL